MKGRWKALDEIYKIYVLLQRSDLNILAECVHICFLLFLRYSLFLYFYVFLFADFSVKFVLVTLKFDEFLSEFGNFFQEMKK